MRKIYTGNPCVDLFIKDLLMNSCIKYVLDKFNELRCENSHLLLILRYPYDKAADIMDSDRSDHRMVYVGNNILYDISSIDSIDMSIVKNIDDLCGVIGEAYLKLFRDTIRQSVAGLCLEVDISGFEEIDTSNLDYDKFVWSCLKHKIKTDNEMEVLKYIYDNRIIYEYDRS